MCVLERLSPWHSMYHVTKISTLSLALLAPISGLSQRQEGKKGKIIKERDGCG
jgi:hypothetical protein